MEPEKGDCRLRRRTPLLAASLLLAVATLHAQLPAPSGAINDFADLLTTEQEQQLTTLVEEVEDATTAEIAVATVTSLDGMSVEEYAVRLFAQWGIGQADKDNGVLILVAPNDREMRIEVGYGLEGILPDGLAGQIVRETFTPAFRDGDYPRGIIDGATRVADVVRRNQPLTPEQRAELDRANSGLGRDTARLVSRALPRPVRGHRFRFRRQRPRRARHRAHLLRAGVRRHSLPARVAPGLVHGAVDPGGPRNRGADRGHPHWPAPVQPRRPPRRRNGIEARVGVGQWRRQRQLVGLVRGIRLVWFVGQLRRRQFGWRWRERAVVRNG